ncbi:MAG: NAD(P)/FAD-dependent oxidoreductase [Bacteroidetes bacterium]|nr:NAD(P)/FAD-dependent oxidoreductase [Bacteroidota bacterium]
MNSTDTKIKTAICIIGAGPAGATTSLFLSKMKIPHVIIDAAEFPRDKVCGDGLDLKVMRVLNNLEPGLVEREILNNENFTQSNSVCIHINEKKKAVLKYTPKLNESIFPFFFFSKRNYFDNFLVKKINPTYATFLQGTKAEKITWNGSESTIIAKNNNTQIEIQAQLLVGADGDHSVVLRSLGERQISRDNYAGGLRQYWKGISDMEDNHLEIYLPKSLPLAYLWIFPLPNGEANVGCGLQSTLIKKNHINLKDLLNDIITNDAVLKDRFKNAIPLETPQGWGLPLASLKRKIAGNGWLLTGDAGSLIYPTTGEGIGPAMMSGYIAAYFIKEAVAKNNFTEESFTNYEREIYKRLNDSIKIYRFLKNTSPILYNFFISYIATHPFCKYYFKKNVAKWIETAYTKKIDVAIS